MTPDQPTQPVAEALTAEEEAALRSEIARLTEGCQPGPWHVAGEDDHDSHWWLDNPAGDSSFPDGQSAATFVNLVPKLLATLDAARSQPIADTTPCPYCHGRRWVDDENWSPEYPESWDGKRHPGEGLMNRILASLDPDEDLAYDDPVAQSGVPMDPVMFVRWDAVLRAIGAAGEGRDHREWCPAVPVAKAVYDGVNGGVEPENDVAALRAIADWMDRLDDATDAQLERYGSGHSVGRTLQATLRRVAATLAESHPAGGEDDRG